MKTKDQFTEPIIGFKEQAAINTSTVKVRINSKKHTCPVCCISFCHVMPSHVEGEFTDATIYNNGSIIPVKPVTCDCCGLKVIS